MGIANKKCGVCGKEFHVCGSCDINTNWEYKYCSDGCWKKSKEYIELSFAFKRIYEKLRRDSLLKDFIVILDTFDSDYGNEVNNWIMEAEEDDL